MYKKELINLQTELKNKQHNFISAIKGYDGYYRAKALQVEIKELEKKIAFSPSDLPAFK